MMELPNTNKVLNFFQEMLVDHLPQTAYQWLQDKCKQATDDKTLATYFLIFSLVPRHIENTDALFAPAELASAAAMRSHLQLGHWTLAQIARTYIVLSMAQAKSTEFNAAFNKLFSTAGMQELVALYQMFPLLPDPQAWCWHATEGIRSNITAVFEAIALHNPYPMEYFSESAWNQLVLKAMFIGSDLTHVLGLETRCNLRLAQMLMDYAQERTAAHRPVHPQLWRLVTLGANDVIKQQLAALQ